MLSVKNLTKNYGKLLACNNVSFEIPENSVNLLVGPNGAGKSTLIKSMLGLLRATGEVTIAGHDKNSLEAKRLTGYVPEIPELYSLLTVEEHMEFVARVYKVDDWEAKTADLFRRFDLDGKRRKLVSQLSKGMRQKLSICTAVLPRPALLLVDEPLIGLDPMAIKEAKKLFKELAASGTTLLISTHILDTVDELWDRILIMKDGYLKAVADRAWLEQQGQSLEDFFFEKAAEKPILEEDVLHQEKEV